MSSNGATTSSTVMVSPPSPLPPQPPPEGASTSLFDDVKVLDDQQRVHIDETLQVPSSTTAGAKPVTTATTAFK